MEFANLAEFYCRFARDGLVRSAVILSFGFLALLSLSLHAQPIDLGFGMQETRTVEVNGTTLTYLDSGPGSGAPIVLVHGALADFRYWQTIYADLTRSHRVIAYSRRGFFPNPVAQTATADPFADRDDLAALLETLELGPVHLVGHSRGGHVALSLASVRPDLLQTVATLEGGFLEAGVSDRALQALASFGPVAEEARALYLDGDPRAAADRFLAYAVGAEAYAGASDSARQIAYDNAHTFGRRPNAGLACADVSSIKIPVLLLLGTQTPPESVAMMEGLKSCMPSIRTVDIPRAAHDIHYANPSAVVSALNEFVADP